MPDSSGRLAQFCLWLFIASLGALAFAYHVKGLVLLTTSLNPTDAHDLSLRWVENRYFLQGKNPYDVWQMHSPLAAAAGFSIHDSPRDAKLDPHLGKNWPVHPPWGYILSMPMLWPSWPLVRWYYAILIVMATCFMGRMCYLLGAPFGRTQGWLLATAALANGGQTYGIAVGQYTALLVPLIMASFWLAQTRRNYWAGIAWAISMIKPTIAGPFAIVFLIRQKFTVVVTASLVLLIASLAAWMTTKTSPLELFHQFSMAGAAAADDGSIGPISFFRNLGFSQSRSTTLAILSVLTPLLLLSLFAKQLSFLSNFGIAAAASRHWTYHRYYDDYLLVFYVLSFGAVACSLRTSKVAWLCFFISGTTVWAPGRLLNSPQFQLYSMAVVVLTLPMLIWLNSQSNSQSSAAS